MTTNQLAAHWAVLQLDNLREKVVLSFQPTADMLIAEVRERAPCQAARNRLLYLLDLYRAAVIELDHCLCALRGQCGTDHGELGLPDADVDDEAARIRAPHERYHRKGAL